MNKRKISNHAKLRMRERTELNHKERVKLFNNALSNGKSINDISDKKLKEFLLSKPNCKIKLYNGYIFIYSKNSKRLYTMYKLPEKFINK